MRKCCNDHGELCSNAPTSNFSLAILVLMAKLARFTTTTFIEDAAPLVSGAEKSAMEGANVQMTSMSPAINGEDVETKM